MAAISSPRPYRLRAMRAFKPSADAPSDGVMSVSTGPGWTLLTVIPRGPRSRASPRVRPAMAALVMAYTLPPGEVLSRPATGKALQGVGPDRAPRLAGLIRSS